MKNYNYYLGLFLSFLSFSIIAQGVAINEDGAAPDASAMLELKSTEQGFLPPRMTEAERDAIVDPTEGLTIYNTTENCLQWWNGNFWYDACGNNPILDYPEGTVFCDGVITEIVEVFHAETGYTWMDRNLGASKVATAIDDCPDYPSDCAYGDLYQWGRFADGHQCRDSPTHSSSATTPTPFTGADWDGKFINVGGTQSSPSLRYWLTPADDDLWDGIDGENNPCPIGFRLPTDAELTNERSSWPTYGGSQAGPNAFASPLKLPRTERRYSSSGTIGDATAGVYWSSTHSTSHRARYLWFGNSSSGVTAQDRAFGFAIRCIKD